MVLHTQHLRNEGGTVDDGAPGAGHAHIIIHAIKPQRPDFSCLTGCEEILFPSLLMGADGGTIATSGVVPEVIMKLYQEFLAGKRELTCTAWAIPTYNVRGWKAPCYLMTDGHYGGYQEMLAKVQWDKYGVVDGKARDPRCENCMVHCGYDPSGALGTNYQRGDNWKNFKYNFWPRPKRYAGGPDLVKTVFNGASVGKGHLAEAKAAINTGLAGAKSAFARGGNGVSGQHADADNSGTGGGSCGGLGRAAGSGGGSVLTACSPKCVPFYNATRVRRLALVTAPLRARFGAVYRLDYYDEIAMRKIVSRALGMLKVTADEEGINEVARRARGTPRIALRLLRRVRDFAQVRGNGVVTHDIASSALDLLQVDPLGLDDVDLVGVTFLVAPEPTREQGFLVSVAEGQAKRSQRASI